VELKGRNVVVTGGAGFIGSHVTDRLKALGARVTVLDDLSVGTLDNLTGAMKASTGDQGPPVRFVRGDVRDPAALDTVLAGADAVYHLAVQCIRISIDSPEFVHEVNATGTLRLCEAATRHKLSRLVYVSSSEVYGTALVAPMDEQHPLVPTTPYGASKAAGELYAKAWHTTYGLPAVVVRPFNSYGPREHFEGPYGEVIPKFVIRALAGVAPAIFGDGEQTRDFTYVEDTARGIVEAGACDALVGDVINIARGEEVTINRLCERVLALVERGDLIALRRPPRPADVRRHYAAVGKAKAVLGFVAPTAIDEGLQRYLSWFRATGLDPAALLKQEVERNWETKGDGGRENAAGSEPRR
jgi:UDP-glucose 4-epimerase